MTKRRMLMLVAPLLVFPADGASQSDQTWATYITEEEWQTVNEPPRCRPADRESGYRPTQSLGGNYPPRLDT